MEEFQFCQDFALIKSYLFSPCWISIFPHYNNTKIQICLNFYFMSNFLWTVNIRDFTDFQSSEARLMTASAVHKLSILFQWFFAKELVFEAPWYCLTRIYNPGMSLALRFLCNWLNAGNVLAHMLLKLSNHTSESLEIGQIPKMTVHKKLLKIKSSQPKFDDKGVISNEEKMIYPARWKKITVDQSNSWKIDCVDFRFWGATRYNQIGWIELSLVFDMLGSCPLHVNIQFMALLN